MDEFTLLQSRMTIIKDMIDSACRRVGRDPSTVKVVPASKTRTADVINLLPKIGVYSVGENRVQEYIDKAGDVTDEIEWHFIGQLQTNKVKYLIDKIACIQSLDRLSLAVEIEKQCVAHGRAEIPCFMEINVADNPLHGGVSDCEAVGLLRQIKKQCPHVRCKGVMTVLPKGEACKPAAVRLKKCLETLAKEQTDMVECSMGMSEDLETAVECGATIVRPGRLLFGERSQ